ncbi:MAG: universal stress protein [Microthrixaceae bacterium]|jgi:nucleotide-binding universal stress UspA family protein
MTGIVVGVDGSENSLEALRWAASEARLRALPLRVVGAFTSPVMASGYEVAAPDPEELHSASSAMLNAAVESVGADGSLDGVECVAEVLEGHPGERLIALSADADLLVVGSRGHGGFMGLMMGSVTTYCVHHAACPVVVVRHRD